MVEFFPKLSKFSSFGKNSTNNNGFIAVYIVSLPGKSKVCKTVRNQGAKGVIRQK